MSSPRRSSNGPDRLGKVLTINGEPLPVLRSHEVDYYSAAFFLTNPELPDAVRNTLSIRRARFVGGGVHEKITIHSFADHPVRFELRLQVGSDFADLFEIKDLVRDRSSQIETRHDPAGSISLRYAADGFEATTHVHASGVARIDGDAFVWDVALEPRGDWKTAVQVEVEHPSLEGRREASPGELRRKLAKGR